MVLPLPRLGQGTWNLGDGRHLPEEEIAALRTGLDLGMTMIDTAEMYGSGASERLVGKAIAGRRAEVFLVSKVLPHHADREGVKTACRESLRRLGTDYLDLYLLHWRGGVPLEETVEAFERLVQEGLIRQWGVSNFDLGDMEELFALRAGTAVRANQLPYNLERRGIEWDLLPWCQEREIPVIAYSPLEQRRLLRRPAVQAMAIALGATPAQVALAWVLRQPGMTAIPESGTTAHVRENHRALALELPAADLAALDLAFEPPRKRRRLEML